jgi:hypothetical protein
MVKPAANADRSPSPPESLGFRHQSVASLDHVRDSLRQRVAGPLLRLPVRPLKLVDLDLLASGLGGAVGTALAFDDGADGAQTVDVPIPAELLGTIKATKATGLKTWLIGSRGGSFTDQGLTDWFSAEMAKGGTARALHAPRPSQTLPDRLGRAGQDHPPDHVRVRSSDHEGGRALHPHGRPGAQRSRRDGGAGLTGGESKMKCRLVGEVAGNWVARGERHESH